MTRAFLFGLPLYLTSFAVARAAPPGGAASAPPPAGPAAAAPASPAETPLAPGERIAVGQAPVIGGNSAGARERALDEAIRQAVDLALGELTDAPTRAAQAKAIKAIEARARTFVSRYRALDEGEANGVYMVRLAAEVDELALRRKIDRWSAGPAAPPPPRPPSAGVWIAAADAEPASEALAADLGTSLPAAGVRARVGGPGATTAAAAAQAAASASLPAGLVVAGSLADEGAVRGTGKISIACRGLARVVAAPGGAPIAERSGTARVFVDRAEAGRAGCLARLAADLRDPIAAALAAASGGGPSGLRTLTIDADVIEPGAIPALLQSVRSVGAVSGAELRRVGAGRAEIQVQTRSAAAPLAAALTRDAAAALALTDLRADGDVIHLRARLRQPATESGSSP